MKLQLEQKIKVLFRGVIKENPYKVIMGVQYEERFIDLHIKENFDNFKKIE